MNNLTNNSSPRPTTRKRLVVASATAIAIANTVSGLIQLTHEQSSETTVVGIEHLGLACLTVMCLLMVPVLFHLGAVAERRVGPAVASAGCIALALLSTSSNIRGEDFSFFPAIAVPSNLAILIGLIVTAVALVRHTSAPRALAAGLPLMWIVALPLAPLGGGLLVAVYWIALAWNLEHDRISATGTSAGGEVRSQPRNLAGAGA